MLAVQSIFMNSAPPCCSTSMPESEEKRYNLFYLDHLVHCDHHFCVNLITNCFGSPDKP